MLDQTTNLAAATALESELGPDEQLLWYGGPRKGLRLQPGDIFLIPFSLIWFGFVFFWEATALLSGAPIFFMLWGIPFFLVGLYLTAGRFFVDARQRERTYYGLTSERALIISGLFNRTTNSIYLRTLNDVSVSERTDGSGTISFGPTHPMAAWAGSMSWGSSRRYLPPSFDSIPDVRYVANLIRDVQRKATLPPAGGETRSF